MKYPLVIKMCYDLHTVQIDHLMYQLNLVVVGFW